MRIRDGVNEELWDGQRSKTGLNYLCFLSRHKQFQMLPMLDYTVHEFNGLLNGFESLVPVQTSKVPGLYCCQGHTSTETPSPLLINVDKGQSSSLPVHTITTQAVPTSLRLSYMQQKQLAKLPMRRHD